jgi:hypothetical protein
MALAILEVYVLENKYSLSINLGDCDYPDNLEDIQISNRFEFLSFFSSLEGHSSASCTIHKRDLKKWLLNSDFEVLSFIEPSSKERKYIVDQNKIPSKILNGEMNFSFQFLLTNDQRTVIRVQRSEKKDIVKIELNYCES